MRLGGGRKRARAYAVVCGVRLMASCSMWAGTSTTRAESKTPLDTRYMMEATRENKTHIFLQPINIQSEGVGGKDRVTCTGPGGERTKFSQNASRTKVVSTKVVSRTTVPRKSLASRENRALCIPKHSSIASCNKDAGLLAEPHGAHRCIASFTCRPDHLASSRNSGSDRTVWYTSACTGDSSQNTCIDQTVPVHAAKSGAEQQWSGTGANGMISCSSGVKWHGTVCVRACRTQFRAC